MGIPILVVEDETELRGLLKAILENSNYSATMAENMRAATHAVAADNGFEFRLILCDLTLPDSPQGETLPAMIQLAKWVPVVVMTGWTDDATQALIRKQGAVDVLLKGDSSWIHELVPFLDRVLARV